LGDRPENQALDLEEGKQDSPDPDAWEPRFAHWHVEEYRAHYRGKAHMKAALYPARIWQADEVYYVQFLDLENGFTYGNTPEEAKEMAADVLTALLSSALEHGEPIPEPGLEEGGEDVYLIAPEATVQAAILLRMARGERSEEEVAREIGTTWQAYHKMESTATAAVTLVNLQKAAKALGKELVIELR
jgi:antitoxin HicB